MHWTFNGTQITLSDVAGVVSAFMSLGALVVSGIALWLAKKASETVMNDWRQQQRSQRTAEVASDALAVLLRVAYFLDRRTKDVDQPDVHKQTKVNSNWEPFKEMSRDYWRARVNIEAHIPEVEDLLREFWESAGQLWIYQQEAGSDSRKFKNAYGDIPRKEISELRQKVKDALMPYARHEK